MNVLVLYYSRRGHTRKAADGIAQAARDLSHEVVIKSVAEIQKVDIERSDVLFVGTWVHGLILFGVRPAGAEMWVPALPSLEGKRVGVFCTYAFHPHSSLQMLGGMLTARGANVVGQYAFHRSNPQRGVDALVRSVLQSG